MKTELKKRDIVGLMMGTSLYESRGDSRLDDVSRNRMIGLRGQRSGKLLEQAMMMDK